MSDQIAAPSAATLPTDRVVDTPTTTPAGLDASQYQQGAAPRADKTAADKQQGDLEVTPINGVIAKTEPPSNPSQSFDAAAPKGPQGETKAAESHKDGTRTEDQGDVKWTFSADGKPIHSVSKDGSVQDLTYDKDGHLLHTKLVSKDGSQCDYNYDKDGKVSEIVVTSANKWVTHLNADQLPLTAISPQGEKITYHYDDNQQLSSIENSNGLTLQYQNNGDGTGHWEKFEHGADKGKADDVTITVFDPKGDSVMHLQNRTVSEWALSRVGSGSATEEGTKWMELRDTTCTALTQAMQGDSNDEHNREKINSYCKQISNFTPEQKEEFLSEYRLKTGHDLASQLQERNLPLAEGYITRQGQEGGTEAPRVKEAIYEIGHGKKEEADILRNSLARLNGEQIAALEKEHPPLSEQLKTLHDNNKLSDESYMTTLLYLKTPSDSPDRNTAQFHKALANIALNCNKGDDVNTPEGTTYAKNIRAASDPEILQLLRESLGPQGNEAENKAAEAARADLVKSGALDKAGHLMESKNSASEARDILQYGHCTLATRIHQNDGSFDNQQTVTDAVKQDMTKEERAQFGAGRKEVESLSAADREKFMNDPDAQGTAEMKYYRDLHNAFVSAGGHDTWIAPQSKSAMVHQWDDLAEHGKVTLEGQLAQQYGGFTNGSEQDFNNVLNHMSKEDFARLQTDPLYRQEINRTLADMVDGGSGFDRYAVDRAQHRIDDIGNRGYMSRDYEAFAGLKVVDLPANASADQIKRSLENISADEQHTLQTFDYEKQQLDKKIAAVPDETQREALRRMENRLLSQDPAKTKHPPDIDAGDQMLFAVADYKAGRITEQQYKKQLIDFSNNPQSKHLVDELSSGSPRSAEAKSFETDMRKALGPAYDSEVLPTLRHTMPLSQLVSSSTIDQPTWDKGGNITHHYNVDFKQFVCSLETISVEDRRHLEEMAKNHDNDGIARALPNMSDAQRDQVIKILANDVPERGHGGMVRSEDILHMYVIDKNSSPEQLTKMLRTMTPDQVEKMQQDYATKYGHDALKDLAERAPDGARAELLRLANPDRNKFADAMDQVNQIDATLRTGALRDTVRTWDGSGGRLDQLVHELAITDDPDKRDLIKAELADAIVDEQGTAQQVSNCIIERIAMGAALCTAPVDGILGPASLALAGGLTKPGVHMAIEGDSYGNNGQDRYGTMAAQGGSAAIGWGGAGAMNMAIGHVIGDKTSGELLERMIAQYGPDRATEAIASAAETYIETHQTPGAQVSPTAAKAEARKYAEALVKAMVRPE